LTSAPEIYYIIGIYISAAARDSSKTILLGFVNMDKELKFLLYSTPSENVKIDVAVEGETIWLTQKAMAALFGTSRENITMHLKSVFECAELQEASVCKKFLLTATDGKNYNTQFYNLDAIISVGYRVNSFKATRSLQQKLQDVPDFYPVV